MGSNKKNGIEMFGVISEFDGCTFRAIGRPLNAHQYVSFLDNVIYPMWKKNENLIFMHDKRQSCLSILWRAIHPKAQFLYWPTVMSDLNPFNKIWANFNDKLAAEFNDNYLTEFHSSWEHTRLDFDNFHSMYETMHYSLQKIIESC
ncbi:hypothetical protein Bhyg_12498, partial [Pseudolycoriella hygida]